MENCNLSLYIQNLITQGKKGNAVLCAHRGQQQVQMALFLPDLSRSSPPGKRGGTGVPFQPYLATAQRAVPGRISPNSAALRRKTREQGSLGRVLNSTESSALFNSFPALQGCKRAYPNSSAFRYLLLSFFATQLARNGGRRSRSVAATDVGILVKRWNKNKLKATGGRGGEETPQGAGSAIDANGSLERGKALATSVRAGNLSYKEYSRKMGRDWLRFHMEDSLCTQLHYRCKFYFFQCPSNHQNALFLATQICASLQERVPFRRIKHQLIQEMSKNPIIKGVRINCSGRVAARSKKAQKAKTESIQWGETSLQVFSELVHFASKSASTVFGKIGVKVWICYAANSRARRNH